MMSSWQCATAAAFLLLLVLGPVLQRAGAYQKTASPSKILEDLVLNYKSKEAAHDRERRAGSDCNTTENRTVKCNLDCRCVDGKWRCCRLRKNINMMTKVEIKRFTDTFVSVANDPRYSPAFASLSWSHAVLTCTFLLEKNGFVYSVKPNLYYAAVGYHNMMIFALENLLRLVDCGVTVPYWDVATSFSKSYKDVFPEGFGSIGVGKDHCVEDGPFRKGAFKIPQFYYKGKALPYMNCLKRKPMEGAVPPFSYQLFQAVLSVRPEIAVLIESAIYQEFDENFHLGIGGSNLGLAAAVDPLLYLLHNYGNKVIANYQIQGPNHFTGGGRWDNDVQLPGFPWFKSKDFLDYFNYPNGVCIRWAASMDRDEAINMGYYAGLEIPRNDHLSLPYKNVREMEVASNAADGLSFLVADLKTHFKSFKWGPGGMSISKNWQNELPPREALEPHGRALKMCSDYVRMDPSFLQFNVSMALSEIV